MSSVETNVQPESRPAVEILGPWLLNKGDYLMLLAVAEQLQDVCTLAVSSDLGMPELPPNPELHKVRWIPTQKDLTAALRAMSLPRIFWLLRDAAALMIAPRSVLRSRGFIAGHDLSALLDCSGFAYGDQWSTRRTDRRARYYARLRAQGARLIMLPQALGPFEDVSVRSSTRAVLNQFDLIFARDETSRQHALSLDLRGPKVKTVPDITHLLNGTPPENPKEWASRACVVPNARMLDKTSPEVRRKYVEFLLRCIHTFQARGHDPFLLLHEKNDKSLAREIQDALSFPISVLDEDPLVSKGILGSCYVVLSSRYHALVGALSQASPALGTTWAHKYDALFEEYDCSECIISALEEQSHIDEKLECILDPRKNDALRDRLEERAELQKDKVRRMWAEVRELLTNPSMQVSR